MSGDGQCPFHKLTADSLRQMHLLPSLDPEVNSATSAKEKKDFPPDDVKEALPSHLTLVTTLTPPKTESSPRSSIKDESTGRLSTSTENVRKRRWCGCIPRCCGGNKTTSEANHSSQNEKDRWNPNLDEGKILSSAFGDFPPQLRGKPIEEIDQNRKNQKSFVIISKRIGKDTIYRFSATKALFILSPLGIVRRAAMYVATNQFFDLLVIICILCNCVFLALPNEVVQAEYVFQAFYTVEMFVRVLARGFVLEKYTYLHDPWNILDFSIILIGYGIIFMENIGSKQTLPINPTALRTFRVLRALKTISVVPGLRTIVNALLKSLRMLMEVMVLTLFCLCVAALLGLQIYMGKLRSKCVRDGPSNMTDAQYQKWITNPGNYKEDPSVEGRFPVVCGNTSYTGLCSTFNNDTMNFTCIQVGENPNWGFTNFDSFSWAIITSFQLITLDFWENVYDYILRATGPWNVLFFVVLVFFGSFYLINLMLAVVTMSYEEESDTVEKEVREEQENKDHMDMIARKRQLEEQKLPSPNDPANRLGTQAPTVPSTGIQSDDQVDGKKGWATMKQRISEKDTTDFGNGADLDDDDRASADGNELPDNDAVDPHEQMVRLNSMWCCGPKCSGCCCREPDRNKWLPVQLYIFKWATDPMFDIIVTLLIAINTLFLALDHHDMPTTLEIVLSYGNQIFATFFLVEALLKIIAMGKEYFKNKWNVFDFAIVGVSILEIIISAINPDSSFDGLTILRVLRLMRVFKLARSWATMRVLLAIIGSTLGALGNLCLILVIIIYIFAVIGMQLLGTGYEEEKWISLGSELPRWNFKDFFHAFMMVFRVLCGEWVEPLYDCMRTNGNILCIVIFLSTLIIGNFLVLNLFLALLLNKFGQENLKKQKQTQKNTRLRTGWKKLQGLLKKNTTRVQPRIIDVLNAAKSTQDDGEPIPQVSPILYALRLAKADGLLEKILDEREMYANLNGNSSPLKSSSNRSKHSNGYVNNNRTPETQEAFDTLNEISRNEKNAAKSQTRQNISVSPTKTKPGGKAGRGGLMLSGENRSLKNNEKDKSKQITIVESANLNPCFPPILTAKCDRCFNCMDKSCIGRMWYGIRSHVFRLVEHRYFEWFILAIIFVSSVSLAFEDIHLDEKPVLKKVLEIANYVFVVIFTLEMILKWIGLGFDKYFRNGWCWLDFFIVVLSLASLIIESQGSVDIGAFRSLRTLRALRPLRAISRWPGMKIVVNALASAIPSIFNVLLVCLLFWLIFSIMGVQLMKGRFHACYDADGSRLGCTQNDTGEPLPITMEWCIENNYAWRNAKVNFDNVLYGYLALFQVATFEGWMEVMTAAVDITDFNTQPCLEKNLAIYVYFIIFIICGAFFTLNLFIGVIIENFNVLQKKYDGEGAVDLLLTQSQRNYYNTLKRLGARKPKKTVKRPKNHILAFFFDISTSTKFEIAIALVILSNMAAMGMEHYEMSDMWNYTLFCLNIMFTTIYTLESLVKIVGLRQQYFLYAWNIFDFIIVLVSITDIVIEGVADSSTMILKPGTLRVIRLFRIGRVLRLIKAAKGIRKLLFALLISIPALFNIGMLLTLLVFIYAIIGMSLFGYVKHNGVINELVNFETFMNSMILLFRLVTSGGWNDVLEGLMITEADSDCDASLKDAGLTGNCGAAYLAVPYMVSFILVTFLIVINMYIAVILENFNQAHQQEEIGITEDDLEMFYAVWQRYDPQATEYIHHAHLGDFCDDLDPPFRLPKPNHIKIVTLKLAMNNEDKVHCLDILKELVKSVLGEVEETEDFRELLMKMEEKHKEQFPTLRTKQVKSDTFKRKQEDHAARLIQKAWFHHRFRQNIRRVSSTFKSFKANNLLPAIHRDQGSDPLDSSLTSIRTPTSDGSQRSRSPSNVSVLEEVNE